jgi:transcriptional regulator with XRE-family HTH domain
MSGDKLSGISRAIAVAGNQSALSKLIWEKCKVHVWQSRVSDWERAGYIPTQEKAELVFRVTGIPVGDLIRQEKREHRRVARKKRVSHV